MPEIDDGIIKVHTAQSVDQAMDRLLGLVRARGLMVFAHIDFAADAALVGQIMRPTQLLIFGSPKAGPPLMLDTLSIALDLPLKVLVAQDVMGMTWYSYNDPTYLPTRHRVAETLIQNIARIKSLVEEAAVSPTLAPISREHPQRSGVENRSTRRDRCARPGWTLTLSLTSRLSSRTSAHRTQSAQAPCPRSNSPKYEGQKSLAGGMICR